MAKRKISIEDRKKATTFFFSMSALFLIGWIAVYLISGKMNVLLYGGMIGTLVVGASEIRSVKKLLKKEGRTP